MAGASKDKVGAPARKRTRKDRIYEDKAKLRDFLNFDTDQSFEVWRNSSLVRPWWEIFIASCADKGLETGKKVVDEPNLIHRIQQGERLGKRKYLAARTNPVYNDAEDYHAWLVFWLAEENMKDRNGCFFGKRLKQHEAWSAMHAFVLWAKRQRSRDAKKKTSKAAKKTTPAEEFTDDDFSEDDVELDAEKGTAVVIWRKGMPDELELDPTTLSRAQIPRMCSYNILTFWAAVDETFELQKHMQRRSFLGSKDGSSFREAQLLANKDSGDKKTIFYLETEPATIIEEASAVPETVIPIQESPGYRDSCYQEMVNEAALTGAERFDMSVRLWRYNLMQAMAKDDDRVQLENVHLKLEGHQDADLQAKSAEIQAVQYTHDTRSLNRQLSRDSQDAAEGDVGLPFSQIRDITEEEIRKYHERNKWIDNSEYQPQNHDEACQNLGIPNPDQPRMEGFLPSITLKMHQPTAINALVEFEESCIGGALNAEEVGLGKTIEMVGLLLHRSNQRRAAIKSGETVPAARPTLIILPQTLIEQWKEEILQFTDRFTVCVYYGPPRKSGDDKVVYVQRGKSGGKLTRDHKFFSGAEENADLIVLTSYATWATRHGPKTQWDWLGDQHREQVGGKKPSKKDTDKALIEAGVLYHSIATDCPFQLHGLFERVILDEGHTIRHQSDDVGWAVSNTGSRFRHMITGTPTFDGVEEFSGIMKFLQEPRLNDKEYLLAMGFTEKQLTNGSHDKPGRVSFLESALYHRDPYLYDDEDPKAALRYCSEAMDKYLFNKLYNKGYNFDTVEKGHRLSQVLKKFMFRRTHSSKLNGVCIGATMPSVQRTIIECAFTDNERAHYEFMMADESTNLFKKSVKDHSVAWSTTAYRKWCLLASWLGFQYLLDYKASKLGNKRKNLTALKILQDVQSGQKRLKQPKENFIPLPAKLSPENTQSVLEKHCTGSPKLRQLLPVLAEVVVLLQEKALLWVNTPAQAEWLEQVLKLCGIKAAQLRPDLSVKDQRQLLSDFNSEDGEIQVLICSYMVSCAGLNIQKQCRTSIEFEPPSNESVRAQELGRVRRTGQPSAWVRHITLLTADTLNTKQDSESILKNLPSLLTQLNLNVWGDGDDKERTYALGAFVIHDDQLIPADDPRVEGLELKPLGADDLLMQIQMQLSGRKPTGTVEALRKQAKAGLLPNASSPTKKRKPSKRGKGPTESSSSKAPEDTATAKVLAEAAASAELTNKKIEAPKDPLWT